MLDTSLRARIVAVAQDDTRFNVIVRLLGGKEVWCLGPLKSVAPVDIPVDAAIVVTGQWVRDPSGREVFFSADDVRLSQSEV